VVTILIVTASVLIPMRASLLSTVWLRAPGSTEIITQHMGTPAAIRCVVVAFAISAAASETEWPDYIMHDVAGLSTIRPAFSDVDGCLWPQSWTASSYAR
jgi:hypothetical protein